MTNFDLSKPIVRFLRVEISISEAVGDESSSRATGKARSENCRNRTKTICDRVEDTSCSNDAGQRAAGRVPLDGIDTATKRCSCRLCFGYPERLRCSNSITGADPPGSSQLGRTRFFPGQTRSHGASLKDLWPTCFYEMIPDRAHEVSLEKETSGTPAGFLRILGDCKVLDYKSCCEWDLVLRCSRCFESICGVARMELHIK